MITEDLVREALAQVKYPGFSRDIVSFGLIKEIWIDDDAVTVKFSLATRDPRIPDQINRDARAALESVDGIGDVNIEFDIKDPPQAATGGGGGEGAAGLGASSIPGVAKVVAVASGKGGVGKSTVAANLAVALAKTGASVGLCDCDLYGPSMALMFGSKERLMANQHNQILPAELCGIKLVSMGCLLADDAPAIVRGPLATRYTQQFLRECDWGELDYLILDLPPGTGDIQLTIVQTIVLDGAVVVTTPQEVALIDARKAVAMFQKVNVTILGFIENMAWFECEHGTRYPIFGEGGGKAEAERLGVPLLGQIPIDIETRERADRGEPVALLNAEENAISGAFHEIAQSVAASVTN